MDASKVKRQIVEVGRFLVYSGRRFLADGGAGTAASLSYSSLLALVPLFAIGLAVLSAFDAFKGLRRDLQMQIFEMLLPEAALAVSDHFAQFVENASRMTGPGVLVLAVTAVLLLNTINGAFNAIWHVSEARPLALRVLVYWTLLTLGPLLLGTSITLSTYAFAVVEWSGVDHYARPLFGLSNLLPFALSTIGFTVLFTVVPNRTVRLRHALVGAAVAALLFEALKKGFGLYLRHFPSYEAVYGALAAVPIFLVWMYLSWAVVLLGAEIAAALPEWRAATAAGGRARGSGARLALALALLDRLRTAARHGATYRESALAKGLPATLDDLDSVLRALHKGGFVVRSSGSRWVLSRDLAAARLGDLLKALGLAMEPGDGWPERALAGVETLAEAETPICRQSLAEILDAGSPAETSLRLGSLA